MNSLSFLDANVLLALLTADHVHRAPAKAWWDGEESSAIGLCRITQLAILRLLTTASVMNGKPLTMDAAWRAYDRLRDDDRVTFLEEPAEIEAHFRAESTWKTVSPKLWADAYLTAFARHVSARIVTFDRALARRSPGSILLA